MVMEDATKDNVSMLLPLNNVRFEDVNKYFIDACKLAGGKVTRADYGGSKCIFYDNKGHAVGSVSIAQESANTYRVITDVLVGKEGDMMDYTRETIMYTDDTTCHISGSQGRFELECYKSDKVPPLFGDSPNIKVSYEVRDRGNYRVAALYIEDKFNEDRTIFNTTRILAASKLPK